MADVDQESDDPSFELHRIRASGERVVATGRARAREQASGLDLDVSLGVVGIIAASRSFARFYSDPEEAIRGTHI